jgi:hypothetical protein
VKRFVLITPEARVASDAFEGVRRYLRQTADEDRIIDRTPEDFQPDVPDCNRRAIVQYIAVTS